MRDALGAPCSEYSRNVGAATPEAAAALPYADSLYWSRRGEVACVAHAPEPASARWTAEQWAPIPMKAMRRQGALYQCQHCSASGRPINHRQLSDDTR